MALALALCALVPAAAWGSHEGDEEGASTVFSVKASHGYRMIVLGSAERDDGDGVVVAYLIDKGRHRAAYYLTKGYVTDTRLKARFAGLGRIDLRLRASGRKGRIRVPEPCGGSSEPYEKATYRGVLRFRGEEGFTAARAGRIAVSPQLWANLICRYGFEVETENVEMGVPGAALTAELKKRSRLAVSLSVVKNRSGGRTLVTAEVGERRHGLTIARAVQYLVGAAAFDYDSSLATASIALPAPFSGTATFQRGATRQWTGDLRVDLPGRADVALTRPGLRPSLVPATWSFEPPEFR